MQRQRPDFVKAWHLFLPPSCVLARTLWGEARGESPGGQVTVAWTIRNRVNDGKTSSWWGEGYAGVCQKPCQFNCWNKNNLNFPYLSSAEQILFRELAQARIAVDQVIDDKVPDPLAEPRTITRSR